MIYPPCWSYARSGATDLSRKLLFIFFFDHSFKYLHLYIHTKVFAASDGEAAMREIKKHSRDMSFHRSAPPDVVVYPARFG